MSTQIPLAWNHLTNEHVPAATFAQCVASIASTGERGACKEFPYVFEVIKPLELEGYAAPAELYQGDQVLGFTDECQGCVITCLWSPRVKRLVAVQYKFRDRLRIVRKSPIYMGK